MLKDINNIFNVTVTLQDTILNLVIALLCGIIISIFYRKSYNGPGYQASYVNSLILLVIVTSLVIMVIGNNLARAFGLVGAMSIIRFRTAVKETMDIIYIFFALATGMAVGVGLHGLALFSSVFVGLITLVLTKSNFATPVKSDLLLQFTFKVNGDDTKAYNDVIDKYCRRSKLINAKTLGESNMMELSYYLGFRDKAKSTNFVRELKKVSGVQQVNLFFDEEYF
jgi:uncharacterized membrane protein YhiD involved in acid resistance